MQNGTFPNSGKIDQIFSHFPVGLRDFELSILGSHLVREIIRTCVLSLDSNKDLKDLHIELDEILVRSIRLSERLWWKEYY